MRRSPVTGDDVLSADAERFERRLTEEISGVRVEMHGSIAGLRVEMRESIAALRVEMHDSMLRSAGR
jgi:hypothetical protein